VANNIPTVTTPLPRDLQQFVQRVREALDGGGLDGVITARKLIVTGLATATPTGGVIAIAGTVESPRPPTNLAASGAHANIILSWDAPTYKGHAYTEIWAHTSDSIGDATLVGMTSGNSFAHALGGSASRYYWARNINQNGLASAFNKTAGTQGTTSTSPNFLMEILVETYGTNSQSPFFQIDSATTINGVSVPAGTYMKNAFIHNASITTAMIQDAAIDSAKIADATIVNGDIANATITGAKINSATITSANIATGTITSANIQDATIQTADIADGAIENAKIGNVIESAAYSAGSAGWKIDKTGAMEMNNATFRGTIDVQGSAGANRLNITSTKIEVIDSSNVTRVKLGDLS
jgi:uncharacterized protein YjbI with pentapeptide repeats